LQHTESCHFPKKLVLAMIAVYCPEERQAIRLHTALAEITIRRLDGWSSFSDAVASATCGLVMVDWLAGNPIVERLHALKSRYPHKPLVLVTRKDADNVRLLRGVAIEEVVWTEEIDQALNSTIERIHRSNGFHTIAATIEATEHMPKRLRHALTHLFQNPRPIATVDELAKSVGCDRRTLWRLWRASVPEDASVRLQDILDWNVLLHAAVLRTQTTSWVGIAAKLSIHEHTLARSAKRLAGLTLRQTAEIGGDGIFEMFCERVLDVLADAKVTHAA